MGMLSSRELRHYWEVGYSLLRDIDDANKHSEHGLAGTGPGGSRYTVMVAGALVGAANIIKEKLFRVAGHMLEAAPRELRHNCATWSSHPRGRDSVTI